MTVVVLGIDALDPALVSDEEHPHLTLEGHRRIETIVSTAGDPSTHELWPTIITGLPPEEHGLILEDDGVAWSNPILSAGSDVAQHVLPRRLRTHIGAWLLNNTAEDAFRTPAGYYAERGIETVFDDTQSVAIGVPNYVVDPDDEDREHALRREMGALFARDPDAETGHVSTDPDAFYEQCMEMSMVRIARVRRALRGMRYELVFGYTSGLDLIGHVSHDRPALQARAYDELNEFVGELADDLEEDDELLLVSDHGLQDGFHTDSAMVAASASHMIEGVQSVLDVRDAIDLELERGSHSPENEGAGDRPEASSEAVREHLDDLGYL